MTAEAAKAAGARGCQSAAMPPRRHRAQRESVMLGHHLVGGHANGGHYARAGTMRRIDHGQVGADEEGYARRDGDEESDDLDYSSGGEESDEDDLETDESDDSELDTDEEDDDIYSSDEEEEN